MKLKDGLIMRQVAGEYVVINAGGETDLRGVITLNETGAALWKRLEQPAELTDLTRALLDEFEVDEQTAAQAAAAFVEKLKERDLLA